MRNLINFISRYYYIFLFILLEVMAVLFIIENSYYQGSKIGNICNNIAAAIYEKQEKITHYFSLKSENERLAAENAILRSQLQSSLMATINDSVSVTDTIYTQQYSYTTTTIMERTIGKRNNYLMLNKGKRQGVEVDMGVICPSGLVGVVVKTTENFSLVMPVLHRDSKRSVRNKRTSATGTLVWKGGSYRRGQVVDYPSSMPIQKGDTIITSGFSSNIPEGTIVGYVEKFTLDPATGFYNIDITFATDYNIIKNVYIIKNLFRKEQQQLGNINNEEESK
jgi:rod shape-determining protein MreC